MAETYNHDIKGLAHRIDRVNIEINRAASGNLAGITEHDYNRWKNQYIPALRGYQRWITAEPSPLDLPETHPTLLTIETPDPFEPVDNQIANDLVRLLSLGRAELVNSQSSSQSSGLISYDNDRFTAVLDKCDSLLDLASSQTPLDMPESMPYYEGVKPGQRGVHRPSGTQTAPLP